MQFNSATIFGVAATVLVLGISNAVGQNEVAALRADLDEARGQTYGLTQAVKVLRSEVNRSRNDQIFSKAAEVAVLAEMSPELRAPLTRSLILDEVACMAAADEQVRSMAVLMEKAGSQPQWGRTLSEKSELGAKKIYLSLIVEALQDSQSNGPLALASAMRRGEEAGESEFFKQAYEQARLSRGDREYDQLMPAWEVLFAEGGEGTGK